MAEPLRFREDGTFTIVQFTDIHWRDGDEKDLQSRHLMETILEAEQPDLVVFTGDVVASYASSDPIKSFLDAVSTVNEQRIPWIFVFGNHDTERLVTRQQFMHVVLITFAGHDHVNDYWGSLHGIWLCYGRATGYNEYGREGYPRGARMIRLRAGQRQFETWLRLDDGTVIWNQPEHRPRRDDEHSG